MNGQLYHLPNRGPERAVGYRQLARELGVSDSFLRTRASEGMPMHGWDFAGRKMFLRSEVEEWLQARNERMGRTA